METTIVLSRPFGACPNVRMKVFPERDGNYRDVSLETFIQARRPNEGLP